MWKEEDEEVDDKNEDEDEEVDDKNEVENEDDEDKMKRVVVTMALVMTTKTQEE